MMPTLVWLASYPKSGNTWMRAFLVNYVLDAREPVDINALGQISNAAARGIFDQAAGFASLALPYQYLDEYRPTLMRQYAASEPVLKFLKVHEAFRKTAAGEPLFPVEVTKGAIYIVRNPLDIVISFADHREATLDDTISAMNQSEFGLATDLGCFQSQFPQYLGTWSHHVKSWVNCTEMPVHVVRYEDMLETPDDVFEAVVRFVGLPFETARLEKAIRFSSFKELRRQEEEKSFRERVGGAYFFRSGRSGSWRTKLTAEQVQTIVENHREVMGRFGYLPE